MKKVRLIIAVVAAALMVMGVGYAAWGYTLPVDVKGDLYTFHPVIYDIRSEGPDAWNNKFSIADDKLSATLTTVKLFPGQSSSYLIYFENLSADMSAKLTGVAFSPMNGERASIVKVEYSLYGGTPAVVDHAGATFTENKVLAPAGGEKVCIRVTVSIPSGETAFPYGTDNSFSFKVTPTFAQVNP